jgi:hypothetical protein
MTPHETPGDSGTDGKDVSTRQTDPQLFCETHRSPTGGLIFVDPTAADRWISASTQTLTEVRR